jgi:hypothetical protein
LIFDNVDIIQFNDEVGNIIPVRDKKDIDIYDLAQTIKVQHGMDIDEIISRPDFYGPGGEELSYAVIDMNAERLAEIDFDISKLKTIDIPVITST